MSTRSCIFIVGAAQDHCEPTVLRLYRHCDGYPEGVLPDLQNTLTTALAKLENARRDATAPLPPIGADYLAAAFAVDSSNATRLAVETELVQPPRPKAWTRALLERVLGVQADIEFTYVVDIGAAAVNCYSTKFGVLGKDYAGTPLQHLLAGIAPADLGAAVAADYSPDYREATERAISAALAALRGLGWHALTRPDFLLTTAARCCKLPLPVLMRERSAISISSLPVSNRDVMAERVDDELASVATF